MVDLDSKQKRSEADRLVAVSVAVEFGHVDDLPALGSGVVNLTCPVCGATGRRLGSPGEAFALEGFTPRTLGGQVAILAQCHGCKKDVTLSHKRS